MEYGGTCLGTDGHQFVVDEPVQEVELLPGLTHGFGEGLRRGDDEVCQRSGVISLLPGEVFEGEHPLLHFDPIPEGGVVHAFRTCEGPTVFRLRLDVMVVIGRACGIDRSTVVGMIESAASLLLTFVIVSGDPP